VIIEVAIATQDWPTRAEKERQRRLERLELGRRLAAAVSEFSVVMMNHRKNSIARAGLAVRTESVRVLLCPAQDLGCKV
jgi:hypothetical protein